MQNLYDLILKSGDGAYVVNRKQRITLWNRPARQMLGFSARDTLGRPCHEVMGGKDLLGNCLCQQACRTMRLAQRRGQVKNFNMATKKKGGRKVDLNFSIIVIPGKGKEPRAVVHLFREIQQLTRRPGEQTGAAEQQNGLPVAADNQWHAALSAREQEVLELLARGNDTRTIAATLFISWATVRNHIRNILQKLGVHAKVQAVAYAYRHGLVQGA